MDLNMDLKNLIQEETEFIELIMSKEDVYKAFKFEVIYHLSSNIVGKIIRIQEDLLNDSSSLIKIYASLRFILETLIQTELLLKEEKYKYKLYYLLVWHHIDKTKRFIERINKEISIMEKYSKLDEDIAFNIFKYQSEKGEIISDFKDQFEKLDMEADQEFIMFAKNYKIDGYGVAGLILKTKVLLEYQGKLKYFCNEKERISKELLENREAANLFSFKNQKSKVYKELKDMRSWEDKAKISNLLDEYILVYNLSSSILHSNSYSIFTNYESTRTECEMIVNLCYAYSKKLFSNIKIFSKFDILKAIESYNVKQ